MSRIWASISPVVMPLAYMDKTFPLHPGLCWSGFSLTDVVRIPPCCSKERRRPPSRSWYVKSSSYVRFLVLVVILAVTKSIGQFSVQTVFHKLCDCLSNRFCISSMLLTQLCCSNSQIFADTPVLLDCDFFFPYIQTSRMVLLFCTTMEDYTFFGIIPSMAWLNEPSNVVAYKKTAWLEYASARQSQFMR